MYKTLPIFTVLGAKVRRMVLELSVIVPSIVVEDDPVPLAGTVWEIVNVKLSVNDPPRLPATLKVPREENVGVDTLPFVPVKVRVMPPAESVLVPELVKTPDVE